MIYLKMRGGRLGNQMFQYAFARMLKEHNPEQNIVFDFSSVFHNHKKDNDGYENALKHLNAIKEIENDKISPKFSMLQKIILHFYYKRMPILDKMSERNAYQLKWCKVLNKFGLYFLDLGYFNFKKDLGHKDIVICGCFESEMYFKNISNIIRQEFTPRLPLLEKNKELMHHIQFSNSVCISIRRGDFVSEANGTHNVCTKKYYLNAIKRIKELIDDPTFIFFSNDIAWVKKNIFIDSVCYYESGDDPVWETLRLMSSCKHFIISNSTFHWWAQYLCTNPNKIVIAPSRWYNNDFIPALYQDNWELVVV